jgi:glycerophosphoryl diester phosphodiesterase
MSRPLAPGVAHARRAAALISLAAALVAVAPAAASVADNPWMSKRFLNIAHQGGEDEFPSNTMYAFRQSLKAGADMLELDVGVTKDHQVVVMHDTSVDRTTNGHGLVHDMTLAQVRRLDGAYWFSPGDNAYDHTRSRKAYRLRGIATGKRRPPKGYRRSDFRVVTLREVLKAFPHTPINIEIKGQTKVEDESEYLANARDLAALLKGVKRRDLIVVSFKQKAVDVFHELVPGIPTAPGIDGAAGFLLGNKPLLDGSVALQLPVTYDLNGNTLQVTTKDNVQRAHKAGYAWQVWLSDDGESPAMWRSIIADCADGIMTAKPRALERLLRKDHIRGPGRRGTAPCR